MRHPSPTSTPPRITAPGPISADGCTRADASTLAPAPTPILLAQRNRWTSSLGVPQRHANAPPPQGCRSEACWIEGSPARRGATEFGADAEMGWCGWKGAWETRARRVAGRTAVEIRFISLDSDNREGGWSTKGVWEQGVSGCGEQSGRAQRVRLLRVSLLCPFIR